MGTLARVRAHAGLWGMVALLGAATVLVVPAAAPAIARIESRAIQDMLGTAPYSDRNVGFLQRIHPVTFEERVDPEQARQELLPALPAALSAVPVLLAVAAGVLAVRLYPWPTRAAAVVVRRLRGAVGFVGLAQLARAPGAMWAVPVVVLAVAVAVSGFAGAVNEGVAAARDAAAIQEVGAHVRVTGADLPPAESVARLPGVAVVATGGRSGRCGREVGTLREGGRVIGVPVVMDVAAYQTVLAELGVAEGLPERVVSAAGGTDPVPVLGSPALAGRDDLVVRIDRVDYPVVVVGDVAGLPAQERDRLWVLVPQQALPAAAGPPQELLVAGAGVDPEAVRELVVQAGVPGPEVSSVAGFRARVEVSGFNDGLTLVLVAGAAAGAAGAVLAVVLALVLQAQARGRVVSLLRTLGMSSRQAQRLLLVELVPWVALAVEVGAAVGIAMPLLLAPALGLRDFTGGVALPVGVDFTTVVVLAGLVAALVAAGVAVEGVINRRRGLDRVLRVE